MVLVLPIVRIIKMTLREKLDDQQLKQEPNKKLWQFQKTEVEDSQSNLHAVKSPKQAFQ